MDEFVNNQKAIIRDEVDQRQPDDIYHDVNYSHLIKGKYHKSQMKSKEVVELIVDHEFNQRF